jgi:hypothetical protein
MPLYRINSNNLLNAGIDGCITEGADCSGRVSVSSPVRGIFTVFLLRSANGKDLMTG